MFNEQDIKDAGKRYYDIVDNKHSEKLKEDKAKAKAKAILVQYLHSIENSMPQTGIPPTHYIVTLRRKSIFGDVRERSGTKLEGWVIMTFGAYDFEVILDRRLGYYVAARQEIVPVDDLAETLVANFISMSEEQIRDIFFKILSGESAKF